MVVLAGLDEAGQILVVNDHGAHLVVEFRKLALTLVEAGPSSITVQSHTVALTSLEAARVNMALVVVVSEGAETRIGVTLPLVDTVHKHRRFLVVRVSGLLVQEQVALICFGISSLTLFDLPVMLILILARIPEGNLRKVLHDFYLFDRLLFERLEIEAAHFCHRDRRKADLVMVVANLVLTLIQFGHLNLLIGLLESLRFSRFANFQDFRLPLELVDFLALFMDDVLHLDNALFESYLHQNEAILR